MWTPRPYRREMSVCVCVSVFRNKLGGGCRGGPPDWGIGTLWGCCRQDSGLRHSRIVVSEVAPGKSLTAITNYIPGPVLEAKG